MMANQPDQLKRRFLRGQGASLTELPWLDKSRVFIDDCTRCGKCVDACETKVIVKGDGGFPTIDFSRGECTFCQQCAIACPEPLFDLSQRSPWQLSATIQETCLANQQVYCRSCSEHCDQQAISFKPGLSATPEIDLANCSGCGACVAPCPVSAITVAEHMK
ncbi:ferredoxin-type protein NapF [Motilimonas sp. E26]|uniref:ferredoxin-type protein NapF n=1 Tax=Motilimonas sp. E26 TaxID=2865674 RepID=UPI001E64AA0E|nr:ferredoxin-type protein NapF [Motilimonas sp. E26]MCE0558811.1 ferredoxin-type protein NapF [Motilimonas sp. E26]